MKRRTFFSTVLLALASVFAPKTSAQALPKTNAFSQGLRRAGTKTAPFHVASLRYHSRYERRTIPPGVIIAQPVGLNKPYFAQAPHIDTEKLKSTTKE